MGSVAAAKSDIAEVLVCMHGNENDRFTYLHRGTKNRKMHTSRRDTFQSINSLPLARIKDGKIKFIDKKYQYQQRGERELKVRDSLEPKVALIKSFPGISSELVDYHVDQGYRGLVIEGTGLGHCPDELIPSLKRAVDEEMPVIMTSQCIYGRTNLNVYSTGRQIHSAGIISLGDISPETAYVKLVWALGQTQNLKEVNEIMQTNIAGEFTQKSSTQYFVRDYGE
jgi:glutamyl-tRNA(Gln) amidotransferase subunit D